MSETEDCCLVIFVKAPVPGKVKTRLVPPLTFESAAALYKGWCVALYKEVNGLAGVRVVLAYDASPELPTPEWMCAGVRAPEFFLQKGADLGARLIDAFERSFERGFKRVCVIGTDSPELPMGYIKEAFESLGAHDFVIGPTQDGGYYLAGMSGRVRAELFRGIEWSTERVYRQTLQKAEELKLRTHILPEHFDVDTAADLGKCGG